MKLEVFEGKTKEEAKEKALEALNVSENEMFCKEEEIKGKLFKATTYKCSAIKISDIAEFLKGKLTELLNNMGIESQFETSVREEQINIKMYSDKNSILIGKNGQTLMAIQTVLRQMVHNEIGMYPYILLDVENYKEKVINEIISNKNPNLLVGLPDVFGYCNSDYFRRVMINCREFLYNYILLYLFLYYNELYHLLFLDQNY